MKYSKELPKEPGYYWSLDHHNTERIELVQWDLTGRRLGINENTYMGWVNKDFINWGRLWAGPIPNPEK